MPQKNWDQAVSEGKNAMDAWLDEERAELLAGEHQQDEGEACQEKS